MIVTTPVKVIPTLTKSVLANPRISVAELRSIVAADVAKRSRRAYLLGSQGQVRLPDLRDVSHNPVYQGFEGLEVVVWSDQLLIHVE